MKVLVTGGAGFIGSHLVDLLLEQGDEIWVIDDLSTGIQAHVDMFDDSDRYHFVKAKVQDETILDEVMEQMDEVYHLAASVGVQLVVNNLVESIENNVRAGEVVLAAANKFKKRVMLTSSSEVYGRSSEKPFTENDDLRMGATIKTRWSYACSKALDEYLGMAYFLERKLPVTVVRLFNTVGERQSAEHGMVVPTFVTQALENKQITVHGEGTQTRCFCHVNNCRIL